jgi:hypothetical protein
MHEEAAESEKEGAEKGSERLVQPMAWFFPYISFGILLQAANCAAKAVSAHCREQQEYLFKKPGREAYPCHRGLWAASWKPAHAFRAYRPIEAKPSKAISIEKVAPQQAP